MMSAKKIVLSPFLTYEESCKSVFNWLEGNYVIEEDSSHPFFRLFRGIDVKPQEIAKYEEDFEWLKENRFIFSSLEEIEKAIRDVWSYINRDTLLHLVLLPAGLDCNFDCRYCYQNRDKRYYTEEHKRRLLGLISKKEIEELSLSFFGGEPLLNKKWIYDFLDDVMVKYSDVKLTATITTNGFLLNQRIFKELIERRIRTFQITLDGTEKEHNNLRPLKNGLPTFRRIVDNLNAIAEVKGDFKIIVRVNYNHLFDINSWLEWLKQQAFSKDRRFFYIFRPIASGWNGKTNQVACKVSDKHRRFTFNSLLLKEGFVTYDYFFYQKGGLFCSAGRDNSFVLNTDFTLSKCTVALDSHINKVGYLSEEGEIVLNENSKLWKSELYPKEECRNCFFYPLCFGNHCPWHNIKHNQIFCPIDKEYYKEIQHQIVQFMESPISTRVESDEF